MDGSKINIYNKSEVFGNISEGDIVADISLIGKIFIVYNSNFSAFNGYVTNFYLKDTNTIHFYLSRQASAVAVRLTAISI